MRYRYWICFGASVLLALVFLVAGVGKLLGQGAFLLEILAVVVNPTVASLIAGWLPWMELVLGACLLIGIAPQIAAGLSTLLIASFIFHNGWMIGHGYRYEPCGCLGVFEKVLGGEFSIVTSLYIDIGLVVLALAIYFSYPGKFLDVRPWFFKRRRAAKGSLAEGRENNGTEDNAVLGS